MSAAIIFPLAAVAEIAGCFAFWAWWRLGASPIWLEPGLFTLGVFGWLLSQVEASAAGRTFAAYGGIYIVASIGWMWWAEGQIPDRWDLFGAIICLVGATIILAAPRGS